LRAALAGGAVTVECGAASSVPWAAQAAAYTALRSRACAAVHTDLPQRSAAPPSLGLLSTEQLAALPSLHLQALAAHERSGEELRARLLACRSAHGLLLVSGGERGARESATPSLLRLAAALRREGELAPETLLAVAANPLRDAPGALAAKLDAGAEAVWTQPLLLRSRCERWLANNACPLPLFVGVALPSCARDVQLWLRLAGVAEEEAEAGALLHAWRAAEAAGEVAAFAEHEARAALRNVRERGLGVHLMPLTAGGYALAERLADAL